MRLFSKKLQMPTPEQALPGRTQRMPVAPKHFVLGDPIAPPFPEGLERAVFGMGCTRARAPPWFRSANAAMSAWSFRHLARRSVAPPPRG